MLEERVAGIAFEGMGLELERIFANYVTLGNYLVS